MEQKKKEKKEALKIDPLKDVKEIMLKLLKLDDSQIRIVKECFEKGSDKVSCEGIYLKGHSLVRLKCYDYLLYKYNFESKLQIQYEKFVDLYLESNRYEWIMECVKKESPKDWGDMEDVSSIDFLYILSGAVTTQGSNSKRRVAIQELTTILNFAFELNSVATLFNRPTFNFQACNYKQTLNNLSQKSKLILPFTFDPDSEDIIKQKVRQNSEQYVGMPEYKDPLFGSSLNIFGVEIKCLGLQNKSYSTSLLAREMLTIFSCSKVLETLSEELYSLLQLEEESDESKFFGEGIQWTLCFLGKQGKTLIEEGQQIPPKLILNFNLKDSSFM